MEQNIIYFFDLLGTVVFAITGAVRGVRLKLDFLGVIVFACTVGVGGGMMRDTIIGATPVAALQDKNYLIACIITGIVVFFTAPRFRAEWNIIRYCDALGLGVFTAIGAAKGAEYGLNSIGIILTGVFTAVGGGVIRDVLARRIPDVLTTDFYATASLLGGILFCVMKSIFEFSFFTTFLIVMVFVTLIRVTAMVFHVKLPVAGYHLLRRKKRKNVR